MDKKIKFRKGISSEIKTGLKIIGSFLIDHYTLSSEDYDDFSQELHIAPDITIFIGRKGDEERIEVTDYKFKLKDNVRWKIKDKKNFSNNTRLLVSFASFAFPILIKEIIGNDTLH